ncbi:MAG: hypothetical protein C4524_01825 [Candidatus Zixiibacteriota bacterium]|nr:MAG: hypothetical protein C4524_01825 [candidate division Zixibacteria bacterium]
MAETLFERRALAEEHYRRGLELKKNGNRQEAVLAFRQSLEDDPAFFDPLLELLVEQEETGEAKDLRTEEVLRRADQKYKLGIALLKHSRPEKALRHLKSACEFENTNAKYHCGYAEALLAAGRQDDAREILRYAAEAHGGSNPRLYRARANVLMAEIHLDSGHRSRARRRLLAAFAQDPANPEIMPLLKRSRLGLFQRLFVLPRLQKKAESRKSNA